MKNTKIDLSEILKRHLNSSLVGCTVPGEAELASLGLDSMSAINLLLDLEESFEITFPDELLNVDTFRTRSSLEAVISSLLA
ncbi:MAG: acyl carrier protein [Symploca sp. SIO2D2]|nr:acyl carrier protein [Symploca sp. SIO2D2]